MLLGGKTAIAVSLTEETTEAVVSRMAALAPVADLFEVRADFVRDLDLAALLKARTKPILLHLPARVGGRALSRPRPPGPAPPAVRGGRAAASTSWTWRRAPGSTDVVAVARRGAGSSCRGTTSRARRTTSTAIHARMAARRPDVVKIAVTARSVADLGRLLAFAARHAGSTALRGSSPSPWARSASPRASSAAATARPSRSPRPRPAARRPPASSRRARLADDLPRPLDLARRRGSTASSARTSCAASRPRSRTAPSPSAGSTPSTCPCRPSRMDALRRGPARPRPLRLQRHAPLQGRRSCRTSTR